MKRENQEYQLGFAFIFFERMCEILYVLMVLELEGRTSVAGR